MKSKYKTRTPLFPPCGTAYSWWLPVLLPVFLLLGGCVYNNISEVEPEESFLGLKDAYQHDVSVLNVVFVHGMGDHPFGEEDALDYQIEIAGKLGFQEMMIQDGLEWDADCQEDFMAYPYFSEKERTRLESRLEQKQAICSLKINEVIVGFVGWRQYRLPDSKKTLNVFELSWDRATELLQKSILELDEKYLETVELDNDLKPIAGGRDRESDRVLINRYLKKFVNQKLGDPVIYLGAYGDSIRRVVAEGLSRIAAVAGTNGEHNYSIVSDSLGSRVVFDALGCALDHPDSDAGSGCDYLHDDRKFAATEMNALSLMANNTTQMFMNANQLPFLELSRAKPPGHKETQVEWLKRFPCESGGPGLLRFLQGRELSKQPVQIVAFTDPNDALSYHLTDRFRKHCVHLAGSGQTPVKFINVRISNVKWTFGVFANPNKAHSDGFRKNQAAIEMLVSGYKAEGTSE